MSSRKKNDGDGPERKLAYSTDPAGYNPFKDLAGQTGEKKKPSYENPVRIKLEKKGRGSKMVSIISGLEGSGLNMKDLAKELKRACGTGGSAKEGEVIIQGDHRDKIIDHLKKKGFSNVKKSGG